MTQVENAVSAILDGWAPSEPIITSDSKITAFGSCFAANISDWLARRNFRVLTRDDARANAYVIAMGEGMVNSFAILQQFEWAWENKIFDQPLWHGYKAEDFGYDESVRLQTKEIFDETDVFILTFGLSEIWYDEPTGNVFWRTIPKDVYDPNRHKFRVSTVEENSSNIREIYKLIRRHRPNAKIIMTLSPIPLIASFRDVSCISANSVSKSILRVSLDEVITEFRDEGYLNYWPSYEIVMDVFRQPFMSDNRHPKREVLDFVMTLFEHSWCVDDHNDRPSLTEAWVSALTASDQLPARVSRFALEKNSIGLRAMAMKRRFHSNGLLNQARKKLLISLAEEWETQGSNPD